MQTKLLSLAMILLLPCCIRQPAAAMAPVEDDKTIVFPPFFDRDATSVGGNSGVYELDGEMLRALAIAANDLLPPSDKPRSCANKQEAHLYRVIRQANIIFVYVYQNPAYCGPEALMLDSGAKYAISTDGRILRRVLDGQVEGPADLTTSEDGGLGVPSRPGVTPAYDAIWNQPLQPKATEAQDGGLAWPVDGGPVDAGHDPMPP
jgi:hypothetical protein